jgi:hypothetical protein
MINHSNGSEGLPDDSKTSSNTCLEHIRECINRDRGEYPLLLSETKKNMATCHSISTTFHIAWYVLVWYLEKICNTIFQFPELSVILKSIQNVSFDTLYPGCDFYEKTEDNVLTVVYIWLNIILKR